MLAFIIIIGSILFFYWILKIGGLLDGNNKKQEERRFKEKPTYSDNTIRDTSDHHRPSYTDTSEAKGCNEFLQEPYGDYKEFNLVGIQYLHLESSDYGVNYGVAFAETDNLFDKNAVSIRHNVYGRQLAFIPKNENEELHKYLMSKEDRQSDAHFKIWTHDGIKIYGKAYIEVLPYTTEEDLKAYEIIRDVCSDEIDKTEIGYKKTKTYLAVNIGQSTICRIYLNTANKYFEYASFSTGSRKYIKKRISKLNDIPSFRTEILESLIYIKSHKK